MRSRSSAEFVPPVWPKGALKRGMLRGKACAAYRLAFQGSRALCSLLAIDANSAALSASCSISAMLLMGGNFLSAPFRPSFIQSKCNHDVNTRVHFTSVSSLAHYFCHRGAGAWINPTSFITPACNTLSRLL